jgi:leader peptidase (prepilin peptidase)/N-methyltransferase
VLGLVVGSFLNVVILRLPARLMHGWRQQSREMLELEVEDAAAPPGIVREPSHCPHCKHPLGAVENIPLVSWLALRGQDRNVPIPFGPFLAAAGWTQFVWGEHILRLYRHVFGLP